MNTNALSATRRQFLATMSAGASLPLLGLVPNARAATGETSSLNGDAEAWHVLRRISHGPRPADFGRYRELGLNQYLEEQLDWKNLDDSATEAYLRAWCPTCFMDDCELVAQPINKTKDELITARLVRAVHSRRQLYELMVGFWNDHFSIHQTKFNSLYRAKTKDENQVIRPHALGYFADMLHASSRSPAMLVYLDNWRNVAWGPNENYARELMELHTLGVDGGYSEQDVKELSRCLTGWSISAGQDGWPCSSQAQGGFMFYPQFHDPGSKQFLGRTIYGNGIQEGIDALNMLITHPATARHLARKLCRFFVGESASAGLIDATAAAYGLKGDIKAMLRAILLSEEFMNSQQDLYRRPFEYGVACLRSLDIAPSEQGIAQLYGMLGGAGHLPYQWPDPDGYPLESEYWLNSNGHLQRWQFILKLVKTKGKDGLPLPIRLAANATTAEDIVTVLADSVLRQPLPQSQHQALVSFAAAGQPADARLSGTHQALAIMYITALLLSSANYQLY